MVASLVMVPLIYAMTVDFHMKDERETMNQVTHKSLCWSCYMMTFQDLFPMATEDVRVPRPPD